MDEKTLAQNDMLTMIRLYVFLNNRRSMFQWNVKKKLQTKAENEIILLPNISTMRYYYYKDIITRKNSKQITNITITIGPWPWMFNLALRFTFQWTLIIAKRRIVSDVKHWKHTQFVFINLQKNLKFKTAICFFSKYTRYMMLQLRVLRYTTRIEPLVIFNFLQISNKFSSNK